METEGANCLPEPVQGHNLTQKVFGNVRFFTIGHVISQLISPVFFD